jgi:DNA-binding transcriptional LysR family regulator
VELRDLRLFVTVAKTGSITKAAEKLGYVQSNVTARIQHLENHLQTPLFYRHARGVTLTAQGDMLLKYAEQILYLARQAERSLDPSSQPRGPLRIGSMETTAAVRLPALLTAFHHDCPEVDLSLRTGPTEDLLQQVLDYELDGAFVAGPVNHPELEQETMLEETLAFIAGHRLDDLSAPDIPRTLLVFRSGCSYRARLEQWVRTRGWLPVKILEFGTLEAILGCVEAGMGISLIPLSVVRHYLGKGMHQGLWVQPLEGDEGRVETLFVRRRDAVMTPALRHFLALGKNLLSTA